MTIRPINFRDFEVRALLDGRKTQTRRIVTPSNSLFNGSPWCKWAKAQKWDWDGAWVDPGPSPAGNSGPYLKLPYGGDDEDWLDSVHRIYPRIRPVELLWVREAALPDFPKEFSYYDWSWREVPDEYRYPEHVIYRATWEGGRIGWHASTSMPRWASRMTLRVTDVRVQRLQEISEEDARAEGTQEPSLRDKIGGACWSERDAFSRLWNSIRGPDAWDANPWVAAITFDVILKNVGEAE